jgi:hypothetical protein
MCLDLQEFYFYVIRIIRILVSYIGEWCPRITYIDFDYLNPVSRWCCGLWSPHSALWFIASPGLLSYSDAGHFVYIHWNIQSNIIIIIIFITWNNEASRYQDVRYTSMFNVILPPFHNKWCYSRKRKIITVITLLALWKHYTS